MNMGRTSQERREIVETKIDNPMVKRWGAQHQVLP